MTAETFLLTTSGPVAARRSPLAHRTEELQAASGPGLTLRALGLRSFFNLRTETRPSGTWEALWLGPDEWLLTSEEGGLPDVEGRLVDVSANHTGLEIQGAHARDLLEKAITVDLHPRSFRPGSSVQTTFARGHVLLWQIGEDHYRLLFRPSFATYFTDWLLDGAREFQEA